MDFLPTLQSWDYNVDQPVSLYQQPSYETPSGMNMRAEPGMELSSGVDPSLPMLPPFQQAFLINQSTPDHADDDMLQSWWHKHPRHWSSKEVLDWVFCAVQRRGGDDSSLRGENFATLSGLQLCQMTREEFLMRDPNHGAYIFDDLQDLLIREAMTFTGPECERPPTADNFPIPSPPGQPFADPTNLTDNEIKVLIGENIYDIGVTFDIPGITEDAYDPGYNSEGCSDRDSDCQSVFTDTMEPENSLNDSKSIVSTNGWCQTDLPCTVSSGSSGSGTGARNRHWTGKKRKTRTNKVANGSHLWEFCRDALNDPKFNPDMLMWENKEEGVFRFVKSAAVARMWGRKKNNPNMTYEKLSRAMRFCRTEGFFSAIPKMGKYPKKLCFKFGEKAIGWEK